MQRRHAERHRPTVIYLLDLSEVCSVQCTPAIDVLINSTSTVQCVVLYSQRRSGVILKYHLNGQCAVAVQRVQYCVLTLQYSSPYGGCAEQIGSHENSDQCDHSLYIFCLS